MASIQGVAICPIEHHPKVLTALANPTGQVRAEGDPRAIARNGHERDRGIRHFRACTPFGGPQRMVSISPARCS
jgi:hypothetical protein